MRNFITETFATLALLFIDKSSRKLVTACARIRLSNAQKELKRSYQNGCKKLLIQKVVIKFLSAIEAGRSQVTLSGVPVPAHLSRKSRKNECLEIDVIRITVQAEIWIVFPEQVHGHNEKFTAAYINAAV